MWAMSATRTAPTSRAISAKAAKSMVRGMAVPPQKMIFGRSLRARSRTSSKSMRRGVTADAVLHAAEPLAGRRDAPAVGEVAAHRQRHAHHGVAGFGEGEIDGEVGGRAGVGLDVGVLDAEDGLGALDGERLDRVDVLLALVVAAARVALAVLVRAGRCRWLPGRRRRRSSRWGSAAGCRPGAVPRRRPGRRVPGPRRRGRGAGGDVPRGGWTGEAWSPPGRSDSWSGRGPGVPRRAAPRGAIPRCRRVPDESGTGGTSERQPQHRSPRVASLCASCRA